MRISLVLLLLTTSPAFAFDVTVEGRLEQGGVVLGTAPAGSTVQFKDHNIPVADDGRFVLGLDRDAPATAEIVIKSQAGERETRTIGIAKRAWDRELIDEVPQNLVTPDPKTAKQIAEDSERLRKARAVLEKGALYRTGFVKPATGAITAKFGSSRVLNGKPTAFHSGLDIGANTGAAVHAAADGKVVLIDADMVLSGQTVMIDHGYGLKSIYIHLSKIAVTEGQSVKQGDVIGNVGETGRVTGPHLYFGMSWFDERIDPETVLAAMPGKRKG
ncbi:MAG: M23 family metallopeptidase [Proteobacteria bacterium]|nr:M23 family metallopeptidase [Pseudomonadota bacterium]